MYVANVTLFINTKPIMPFINKITKEVFLSNRIDRILTYNNNFPEMYIIF